MKLLPYYNASEVALRYYNTLEPGKYEATNEGKAMAQKRFFKTNTIDFKVLNKVVSDIAKEQKKEFK